MDNILTRHLIITGLVQGVGFRWATTSEARRLGLAGWVRNRRDGSVEAVVQGAPKAVAALIVWAHRGPAGAQVQEVREEAWDAPVAPGFRQVATV